jgi:hypothetical protein
MQDKEAAAKAKKEAAKALRQPCVYRTYTPDHCAVLVNFFWILSCHFLQDKEAAAKAKKEAAKCEGHALRCFVLVNRAKGQQLNPGSCAAAAKSPATYRVP